MNKLFLFLFFGTVSDTTQYDPSTDVVGAGRGGGGRGCSTLIAQSRASAWRERGLCRLHNHHIIYIILIILKVVVMPNEAGPPKDSKSEKRPVRPVVWRPMSLDRREPLEEGDTHRVMDMDRPW